MLVIPDGNDLSRSFRMLSEDAAEASNLLGIECLPEAESNVDGIKYHLVLKKAVGTGMPLLARLDLSTLRADCEHDLYTAPIDPAHNDAAKVKRESNSVEPGDQAPTDWIAAYESFLRIISRSKDSGIPTASIEDALPRIEAVAEIANLYQGTAADSLIEKQIRTLLASEFDFNTRRGQLWSAIAKDPARWLVIATHLKSKLLYEEAFIHVAGSFPDDCLWNFKMEMAGKQLPDAVRSSIASRSGELFQLRNGIERRLLCLTLTHEFQAPGRAGKTPCPVGPLNQTTAWHVVNTFRQWMVEHLEYLAISTCGHNAGCSPLNGVFRTIAQAGDAYLAPSSIAQRWVHLYGEEAPRPEIRKYLNDLKGQAAELVKPLLKQSTLHVPEEELEYLTCIEVGEEDLPW